MCLFGAAGKRQRLWDDVRCGVVRRPALGRLWVWRRAHRSWVDVWFGSGWLRCCDAELAVGLWAWLGEAGISTGCCVVAGFD